MTQPRTGLSLLSAAIALAAVSPTAAMAEYLVPPGNSAATQYTEALPTAGGDRDAEKGRRGAHRSPGEVLGTRKAHQLGRQGRAGREAAKLAAATAPVTSTSAEEAATETSGSGRGNGDRQTSAERTQDAAPGAERPPAGNAAQPSAAPDGSSGFSEVIAQATGSSSSGETGLLLPLVILAAIAWSVAYLLRQRKRPTS